MRVLAVLPLLLVAVSSVAGQSGAEKASTTTTAVVALPGELKWSAAPALLPAGARLAVIEGDPAKAGEFTMRLWMPANYRIPSHFHPVTEHVTVVKGTFFVGMGEKFDARQGQRLPVGSFGALPAGMRHFAWTEGETIVQLHGVGPWSHLREPRRRPDAQEQVNVTQAHLAMVDATEWFEQDVMLLLPQLLASARRMCRNATDAEDLVAEAIAKAWRHRDTLRERERLRGWLFRILTNTYLSERRARATQPELRPLETETEESAFSLFERLHQPFLLWWGNPEQEFLTRLLEQDLERALDALTEPFRLTVLLADVQGLSYQEIAAALDLPIGTVRSRLARGRSQLQKALWKHAQDAGLTDSDSNPTTS